MAASFPQDAPPPLAQTMQIVFFTHHDHMLNMAQGALPGVLQDGEYSLCADGEHAANTIDAAITAD